MKRHYEVHLTINRRKINTVVIDPHYEIKHSKSVNDEIIMALIQSLDGGEFEPECVGSDGFEYFSTEPHFFGGKPFKIIWVLPPKGNYIGIINCYRRGYGKK